MAATVSKNTTTAPARIATSAVCKEERKLHSRKTVSTKKLSQKNGHTNEKIIVFKIVISKDSQRVTELSVRRETLRETRKWSQEIMWLR